MRKRGILIVFMAFLLLVSLAPSVDASGWGFKKNDDHTTPEIGSYQKMIEDTNSYYIGDATKKKVYLTFDAGYDNGNLQTILDTLAIKKVHATFFVTGDFINRFGDLTLEMMLDGHVIANHSYSHRGITSLSKDELKADLERLEHTYEKLTLSTMPKLFRPPEGTFDRTSLLYLKELGYKTVFWSIAFKDWEENKQNGKLYSYNSVVDNLHNGAIILMHTVSSSNAEALGDIIDEIKRQGYEIALTTEL